MLYVKFIMNDSPLILPTIYNADEKKLENLTTYYLKNETNYCIHYTSSYINPFCIDFDCLKCKEKIPHEKINNVESFSQNVISIVNNELNGPFLNEDNVAVYQRADNCGVHFYSNVFCSIIVYDEMLKNIKCNLNEKYLFLDNTIEYLDLPYNTLRNSNYNIQVFGNLEKIEYCGSFLDFTSYEIVHFNFDELKYILIGILNSIIQQSNKYLCRNLCLVANKNIDVTSYPDVSTFNVICEKYLFESSTHKRSSIYLSKYKKPANVIRCLNFENTKKSFCIENIVKTICTTIDQENKDSIFFDYFCMPNYTGNHLFYIYTTIYFIFLKNRDNLNQFQNYLLMLCNFSEQKLLEERIKKIYNLLSSENLISRLNVYWANSSKKEERWLMWFSEEYKKQYGNNVDFFDEFSNFFEENETINLSNWTILNQFIEKHKYQYYSNGKNYVWNGEIYLSGNIDKKDGSSPSELFNILVNQMKQIKSITNRNIIQPIAKKIMNNDIGKIQENVYEFFVNTEYGVWNNLMGEYMVPCPNLYFSTKMRICGFCTKMNNYKQELIKTDSGILREINDELQKNHNSVKGILQYYYNTQASLFIYTILLPGLLSFDKSVKTLNIKQIFHAINKICEILQMRTAFDDRAIEKLVEFYFYKSIDCSKILYVISTFEKLKIQPKKTVGNIINMLRHYKDTQEPPKYHSTYDELISYLKYKNISIESFLSFYIFLFVLNFEPSRKLKDTLEYEIITNNLDNLKIKNDVDLLNRLLNNDYKMHEIQDILAVKFFTFKNRCIDENIIRVLYSLSLMSNFDKNWLSDFLLYNAQLLLPGRVRKGLVLLIGPGKSGKTKFASLIISIAGESSISLDKVRYKSDGPDVVMSNVNSKYVLNFSELSQLYTGIFKILTGDDQLATRGLYENKVTSKSPISFLFGASNIYPTLDYIDLATKDRLFVFSTENIFQDFSNNEWESNCFVNFCTNVIDRFPNYNEIERSNALAEILYCTYLNNTNNDQTLALSNAKNIVIEKNIWTILAKNSPLFAILNRLDTIFDNSSQISFEALLIKCNELHIFNQSNKYKNIENEHDFIEQLKKEFKTDEDCVYGLRLKSQTRDILNLLKDLKFIKTTNTRATIADINNFLIRCMLDVQNNNNFAISQFLKYYRDVYNITNELVNYNIQFEKSKDEFVYLF